MARAPPLSSSEDSAPQASHSAGPGEMSATTMKMTESGWSSAAPLWSGIKSSAEPMPPKDMIAPAQTMPTSKTAPGQS